MNWQGEIDRKAGDDYLSQLMESFLASPEAASVESPAHYVDFIMRYGLRIEGVTPAQMTPAIFGGLLYNLLPNKYSCKASAAPQIVEELRAFWTFVGRAFGLDNAKPCLALLDDDAVDRLHAKLANPRNYGMAKSFMMEAVNAGVDMSSESAIKSWLAQNALSNAREHVVDDLDSFGGYEQPDIRMVDDPFFAITGTGPRRQSSKNKRKMQKASRRRNR